MRWPGLETQTKVATNWRRRRGSMSEPSRNAVPCGQLAWKGLNITHETRTGSCFLGTGLERIALPADFSWIGPAAFEHCTRLQTVDISRTGIQEIVGGAFACCPQLQCLKLTKTLRRIGREAFMKCSSLEVIHTPPALPYIKKRAFAGCTQLCKLVRMGKKGTWRGTYVEHNTFEMRTKLTLPSWIRSLPKPDAAKEEWEEFMISCAEVTLSKTARS